MCQVDLLTELSNPNRIRRMRCDILHLGGKVGSITGLKKHQRVRSEVVLNAKRRGRDHRLSQSQILKYPRRCVDLSKGIALIRNDAHVATLNLTGKRFKLPRTKIMNSAGQAELLRFIHYLLEVRSALTKYPQFGFWNSLPNLVQRVDCQLETVSFHERSVIHHD